jgi:hypothetical protein
MPNFSMQQSARSGLQMNWSRSARPVIVSFGRQAKVEQV